MELGAHPVAFLTLADKLTAGSEDWHGLSLYVHLRANRPSTRTHQTGAVRVCRPLGKRI